MIVKKDEMAALQAAHQIEYDSEEAYLKAMFETVVELLSQRDSYGVGVKFSGYTVPYGPYYGKAQAKKFAGRMASVLGTERLVIQPLFAPSKLEDPTEEKISE